MHVDWSEGCLPFVPCVLCGEIEIKFARQLGSMGTSYTYTYTLLDPLGVTVRTRGTASAAFLFFFRCTTQHCCYLQMARFSGAIDRVRNTSPAGIRNAHSSRLAACQQQYRQCICTT